MPKFDPLTDKIVTLFGGSGFLGKYVAEELLRRDARVRIACRHPERAFTLKPLAKLGQIQFLRCDVTRPSHVAFALEGADAAVNLVGSFEGDLAKLMGQAPETIARQAARGGLEALVHVSAIGADRDSASSYARAKAMGEQAVFEQFARASVMRPSVVFAEDDHFINMFARLIQLFPILPVFGPDAQLQPVYALDVARAIVAALEAPRRHGGKIFELGGPEVLTMLQLHRMIAQAQRRKRHFIAMPDWASALFAALPATPMSRDQWIMLKSGNVVSGDHPGLEKLAITPSPLELFLDDWMVPYRKHGRFTEAPVESAA